MPHYVPGSQVRSWVALQYERLIGSSRTEFRD